MPKIVVEIEWDVPDEPFWLNADNVALALHAYCENTRFTVREPVCLSASEAVYGFAGWLTTRPERVVISSRDDAAIVADLVAEFCRVNQFANPREGWADSLVHPG